LLRVDRNIFEQRAKFKEVKVRLNIKQDDDILVNDLRVRATPDIVSNADIQQPPKRKMSDYPQLQRPPGSQLGRLPGRSDGRPLDADLDGGYLTDQASVLVGFLVGVEAEDSHS